MLVKGTRIRFQIDTGATCNVVKERELPGQCEVHPTRRMLRLYNNQKLAPVGICELELTNPRTSQVFTKEFVVLKEAETSILGAEAAQSMGLVEVRYDQIERFHQFTYGVPLWVESDHKPLEMITRKALHMAWKWTYS